MEIFLIQVLNLQLRPFSELWFAEPHSHQPLHVCKDNSSEQLRTIQWLGQTTKQYKERRRFENYYVLFWLFHRSSRQPNKTKATVIPISSLVNILGCNSGWGEDLDWILHDDCLDVPANSGVLYHSGQFLSAASLRPQLCSYSLRLCRVSQTKLWPWGMWHRVLLPLSAAVAPQPDMWPGAASASPPHLRRQRCLNTVRLQWRIWRRWEWQLLLPSLLKQEQGCAIVDFKICAVTT